MLRHESLPVRGRTPDWNADIPTSTPQSSCSGRGLVWQVPMIVTLTDGLVLASMGERGPGGADGDIFFSLFSYLRITSNTDPPLKLAEQSQKKAAIRRAVNHPVPVILARPRSPCSSKPSANPTGGRSSLTLVSSSTTSSWPAKRAQIATTNPNDESVICNVQAALAEDVDLAVEAARAALKNSEWRTKAPHRRAPVATKLGCTLRESVGVCGQIIPWNYLMGMASWKPGRTSCYKTVVLKAAERTPLTVLYLARLSVEAGFPPGVINVINGLGSVTGAALCSQPDVDKIAFTGSTVTGKTVMKLTSETLKDISIETGGKSPFIVFPDANMDQASNIHDDFVVRLTAFIRETNVVGDPFDDKTFQDPQVTRDQYERVLGFIQRAKMQGETAALGANPASEPTVFTNVSREMELFQEEIFGPIAIVTVFGTEEEAIDLANDSNYGLGAAIFTQDIQHAHRMASSPEFGQIWITAITTRTRPCPLVAGGRAASAASLGRRGWVRTVQ
ncbi:hypothetical protein MAPG_04511 [Magnaporthiopsis poae ATCC 64411]|uniref:aldehyde dehydrogenase (NAD(+)) n=1 Tax=Magnaporthiopsis poae (strain ATCC 64411 / 73-15) TaxID=644358 RepID=A0A0C4DWX7_MAGP6|nr:hypothetical protein MAPG_04511 [Magnaporthiopsis poae ATCC 64411]